MSAKQARIGVFYAVTALYWAASYSYVPILSSYASGLGATEVMVGTILGSYGFTQMLLRVPLGIFSDKIGKRKVFLLVGGALGGLSALGMALSRTPLLFMIFRGMAGAAASSWVTYTVLFSSYFDADKAPQAMSRLMVFNNLGQVAAMLLGGWIADLVSPQASFLLAVVFGAAAVCLGLLITENPPVNPKPLRIGELLSVGLNKNLLLVSFIAVLYQVINQGTSMGFTPKYASSLGATSTQMSLITSITVIGSMTSSYCMRFVTPKIGAKRGMLVGQLLTACAIVSIGLWVKNVPLLLALQFLVGVGNGMSYPMLMGMAIRDIPQEKRGAAMGFFQSIYGLGMFIGPMITGVLSQSFSLAISIALVGCVGFLSFVLTLVAVPGGAKKA